MPITTAGWTIPAGSYESVSWTVTDPNTGALLDLTQPGWSVAGGIVERYGGPVVHSWTDSAFTRTAAGIVRLVVPGSVSTLWMFRAGWFQIELTHPVGGPVRIEDLRLIVTPEINRT